MEKVFTFLGWLAMITLVPVSFQNVVTFTFYRIVGVFILQDMGKKTLRMRQVQWQK